MQKKKVALFQSVIALILCVSMLVGSTFAWFTDSVQSGINTIAAGNLDVELYHSNAAVKDEQVNANTKLFLDLQGDPILWEPGVVSYENLKITNEGDLALAYQLAIATANENFVLDPSGAQYGLSQILKVGIVEGGITATDRAGVVASVAEDNWVTLATFLRSGSLLPEGKGTSEETWGLVIYWEPGDNDNYWNLNNGKTLSSGDVLSIDLGIRLIATQEVYESDSFGNDYDTDAKADVFPEFAGGSASATVVPNGQNQTSAAVTMTSGPVSAVVPAGVQLAAGTTQLTMSVTNMGASGANIQLAEDEAIRSLDVHIEGVAADNTTPITVVLKEAAPIGLNFGNYKLYHVEADGTKEMTLVAAADDFTAHNQFKYDPATGDITLYMATFSEVAVVAEPAKWEGKFDYSWYTGAVALADSEAATEYVIANADQLAALSAIVGGMDGQTQDSFSGKTVKLIADINLGDKESENNPDIIFYPIGYYNSEGTYERTNTAITSGLRNFEGTFDGQGHTISNFYHNTWEMKGDHNWYAPEKQYYRDGMGLFGRVYGGTVKNLTIDNFSSDGEIATTGCVAAYAEGATFKNIAITNCNPRVYNIGNGGIVGCVGWYAKEAGLKTTFENITVDNSNKISALWGSYDVACGGIVGQYYPTSGQSSANYPVNAGIDLVNCHVAAQMDVYNDVCGNYQYYAYRYAGMMIGSIRENTTTVIDGVTKTIPDMTGISATGCTVNYGDWNDYYYCEFEKNGHPSYSGPNDYKFSRVPDSELEFTDSNDNGKVDADERASVTGCKHSHTDAEDNRAIYLPFHQLFTGYGWGVNSIGLEKYNGIVTNLDITEGDQEASVEKFEKKLTAEDAALEAGREYKVGDLFTAIDENKINDAAVQVAVTGADGSEITAKYVANTTDWTQGTLTFSKIEGVCSVTIQDYNFCKPTSIILKDGKLVEEVEKFVIVLPNTDKYLYRVGNLNEIQLKYLFTENGYPVDDANVRVSVDVGTEKCAVKENTTTWENGTIDFADDFTGLAKITISEAGSEKTLNVEVVDAKNYPSPTSGASLNATANNVVLLDNCGFSSLEVSGGYTLYGNGFTMTCGSDSASLSFGQFVELNNGTLDNVQIVCPNYDYAALYNSQLKSDANRSATTNGTTRYYNAKSAVLATGNSQILNSRISGGRAALYASNGNIVVDNSRLEGGAVATVIISAANSFVFRDATLIQKPTASTYDSNKVLMGMSVLYLCNADGSATPTTLEGSFVQNAWADSSCTAYMPTGTSSIADTVLGMEGYTHTVNGKTSVNLGFAYMPNEGTTVAMPSNITDNRTDCSTIPYSYANVNASVPSGGLTVTVDTYVYTYGSGSGTNENFTGDAEYVPNKYSDIITVSYSDTAEGLTSSKSYGTDGWVYELNVDLDKASGYKLDFGKLSMTVNGVSTTDFKVNGSDKPTAPVAVTAGATTYTLTATVENKVYTATYIVTGVKTTKDAPYLINGVNGDRISQDDVAWGVAKCVTRKDDSGSTNYTVTAPVLEGIVIRYWSVADNKYKDLELADITPGNSQALNGKNNYWEYVAPGNDYTLTVTNTAYVHENNKKYAMPVVYNGTMYFVGSDENAFVSTGSGARNLTMKYVFEDNNGGTLEFTHTWAKAYDSNNPLSYKDMTGIKDGCVTPDTLITLANGKQVRVDSLTGTEELLVWNLKTGKYEAAPIVFVDSEEEAAYEIIHLYFSDSSDVKVIYEHGFFDLDLGKYVYIDATNYADYIGHRFVAQGDLEANQWNVVTLDKAVLETEVTTAWSPVTYKQLCYYTNGVLSMPGGIDGLFNIFEVDTDSMRYNTWKKMADIATYGLFTYEDFAGLIPQEAFEAFNGKYLKVAIGKGMLTWEDIEYLAERYIPLM